MNYKAPSKASSQNQLLEYEFLPSINAEDPQQQSLDFQKINSLFVNIQNLYINKKDEEALECINSLNSKEIANFPCIFPLFEASNCASILLDYLSNNFDFAYNRTAILSIINFTSSSDERYINIFMHLPIIERIHHLLNEYQILSSFALLEISYICYYSKSLDYFYQVGFDFNKFFQFLFESQGRNSSAFMESFKLLVSILDLKININEIILVLINIDEFIKKISISKLSLYTDLLDFVVELTCYENFYEITNHTKLIPDLIDLLYRIDNPNDIEIKFVHLLLSLISFFSQQSNCPVIQGSFLIDFYFKFQDPKVSPFIFYIIGNLCKYQNEKSQNLVHSALGTNPCLSLINEAIQKGFIMALGKEVMASKYYKKIEALSCFSKMIYCSTQTIRIALINSSCLTLINLVSQLIDSLFFEIDDTLYDRILAILCIFEDVQKTFSRDKILSFIDETEISTIFDLEFDDEEENEILEKLKSSISNFYNTDQQ